MQAQLFRFLSKKIPLSKAGKILNLWPPFLGAGIRLVEIADNGRYARVRMHLTRLNCNLVGTQFGGSLYAMTDPFYMWMLMENLGRDYIVWDKAAEIRFRSPGRGPVVAEFRLSEEEIDEIRAQADAKERHEPKFLVEIHDESGKLVATVSKTLHVRRKARAGQSR